MSENKQGENLKSSLGAATPSADKVATSQSVNNSQQISEDAKDDQAVKSSPNDNPSLEATANSEATTKPKKPSNKGKQGKSGKNRNSSAKSNSGLQNQGKLLKAGLRYKGRVRLGKGTTIIATTHTSALMVAIDRGAKLPDGKLLRIPVVCIQPYGDKYPLRVSGRINILPNDLVLIAKGHNAALYIVNTGVTISKNAKRALSPVEICVLESNTWVSGVDDNNQPCYKVIVEVDSANFSPSLVAEYDNSGQPVLWLTNVTIRILE